MRKRLVGVSLERYLRITIVYEVVVGFNLIGIPVLRFSHRQLSISDPILICGWKVASLELSHHHLPRSNSQQTETVAVGNVDVYYGTATLVLTSNQRTLLFRQK